MSSPAASESRQPSTATQRHRVVVSTFTKPGLRPHHKQPPCAAYRASGEVEEHRHTLQLHLLLQFRHGRPLVGGHRQEGHQQRQHVNQESAVPKLKEDAAGA